MGHPLSDDILSVSNPLYVLKDDEAMTAGEFAYRIYHKHRLSHNEKLMQWEDLPERIRDAWELVGIAVRDAKETKACKKTESTS